MLHTGDFVVVIVVVLICYFKLLAGQHGGAQSSNLGHSVKFAFTLPVLVLWRIMRLFVSICRSLDAVDW